MATVNKNFRIKHGLVVEGTTATIGGQNILTETGGDSYILNLVGGATLVKSVDAGVFSVDGAGNLTVNANTFDSYGSASAAQTAAEATASADATSKANAAQAAAEATASADATSKANAAQTAAEGYADGLAVNYDAAGSAAAAQTAAEGFATQAIASLVDSAPATLDTLNELAAALQDNPDVISDLQDIAAGKQDALTAGSNIDITGSTISVTGLSTDDVAEDAGNKYFTDQRALDATAAAYDVVGSAAGALEQANDYTDGEITTALTTAQAALNNVLDATTAFTEINVNDQAKQIAATATITTGSASTVYQWAKADYRSAKLLVKIDNGTHNEISEILLTLDSSDNVAITEYAIVGTNGSRGTIAATISGSNVIVTVNPTDNSTVKVTGTLLK